MPSERVTKVMVLATTAALAGWQAWLFLPAHQQTQIRMRILRIAGASAGRAARWAGWHGIDLEYLEGSEQAGAPWYAAAHQLGHLTLTAHRAYERARDAS